MESALVFPPDFSPGERRLAAERLMGLLARRMRYALMGESASMPVERAAALLESVAFTLDTHLRVTGLSPRALLEGDPDALLDAAVATLERLVRKGRRLHALAKATAPTLENESLADTLRGLSAFFARYDVRALAQEIPGDIDYQLCRAVPETLRGILYVNEYLRRLILENQFLARFSPARAARLLRRFCPDPVGQHINLYEPVATAALGAALTGRDIGALDMPPGACAAAERLFCARSREQGEALLAQAAQRVCDALAVTQPAARAYLAGTAAALAPRLYAALPGGLSGVFLSI